MTSIGFIGANKCGLDTDIMNISCNVRYTGNIAPELQWLHGDNLTVHKSHVKFVTINNVAIASLLIPADNSDYPSNKFMCSVMEPSTNRAISHIKHGYHCKINDLRIMGKYGF